jgi:hypothetical protein
MASVMAKIEALKQVLRLVVAMLSTVSGVA